MSRLIFNPSNASYFWRISKSILMEYLLYGLLFLFTLFAQIMMGRWVYRWDKMTKKNPAQFGITVVISFAMLGFGLLIFCITAMMV